MNENTVSMKLPISSMAALALTLGVPAVEEGHAQEYPAKPIRLIISSSPGSGVDTIARAVAQRMGDVHPSLPVKGVKELIALAKARPGQLNYGSGGTGNSTHLTGEYFKHLTQTNIRRSGQGKEARR